MGLCTIAVNRTESPGWIRYPRKKGSSQGLVSGPAAPMRSMIWLKSSRRSGMITLRWCSTRWGTSRPWASTRSTDIPRTQPLMGIAIARGVGC